MFLVFLLGLMFFIALVGFCSSSVKGVDCENDSRVINGTQYNGAQFNGTQFNGM